MKSIVSFALKLGTGTVKRPRLDQYRSNGPDDTDSEYEATNVMGGTKNTRKSTESDTNTLKLDGDIFKSLSKINFMTLRT